VERILLSIASLTISRKPLLYLSQLLDHSYQINMSSQCDRSKYLLNHPPLSLLSRPCTHKQMLLLEYLQVQTIPKMTMIHREFPS